MTDKLQSERNVKALERPLEWAPGVVKLYSELGKLVTYFQVELAPVDDSVQALVDPMQLVPFASRSATSDDVPNEVLRTMLIPISVYDDIPTVDGIPIWERFSGESIPYYEAFKSYRDLKKYTGSRSILKASEATKIEPKVLALLSKVWHWPVRVRAFDEYEAKRKIVQRARLAEETDSYLYQNAHKMLEKLLRYFDDNEGKITPKIASDLMKTLIPVMRITSGLPGNSPIEEIKSNGGSSRGSVNVNINNANGDGSQATSVHGMSASEVMRKTEEQAKEPSYLAGIINTMIQSGALESTVLNEPEMIDVVDADIKEEK